jgi:hypothetical protein
MIKITENQWAFIEVEHEFLKTICIQGFKDEHWDQYIKFRQLLKDYMKVAYCDWKLGEKQKLETQINVIYNQNIMLQSIMQSGIRYLQAIKIRNVGTHAGHCCKKHGCKYGDEDCPVQFGHIIQDYPCEWCNDPHEIYMNAVTEMCDKSFLDMDMPQIIKERLTKLIEARDKYYHQDHQEE